LEGGAPTPPQPRPAGDERLLSAIDRAFDRIAGERETIGASELKRALGLRSAFLAERVLDLFDENRDGQVSRGEFVSLARSLTLGSREEKLRFLFRLHDADEDGSIDRGELELILSLGLAEDEVDSSDERVQRLAAALLAEADSNRDGRISAAELESLASRHPDVLEQITRSTARWIAPDEELLRSFGRRDAPLRRRVSEWFERNGTFGAWSALWALCNVALFVRAALHYREAGANGFIQLARGAGACLNLNGAMLLLPMLRRTITFLRKTPLHHFLVLDEAIDIHRVIGHAAFGFALLHSAAHLCNYAVGTGRPFAAQLFGTHAGLTGFALLVVFAVMWFFARVAIRRSRRFEQFFYSHLLFVIWFALALKHGPVFWMWAGVPIGIYALDRVTRLLTRTRRVEIASLTPLRSGVTRVEIVRPAGFGHDAGDYLFICIPALARSEWHPFTISSAPEAANLTLHVRSLGNWTAALRQRAEDRQRHDDEQPLAAYVDGPYGTPSAHIFEARNVVLVGAGIGVTPFAAILESIFLRARGEGKPLPNIAKVHFMWLNKDAFSFEWFSALLSRIEQEDHHGLFDIRIFMTEGRADLTAGTLNIARDILHDRGHPDLVTGLHALTHFGFPDWDELIRDVAKAHEPERVDLFYCGPPALAAIIRRACRRHGVRFRLEHF
jgi:predicted ferric reductase/Ca2+-binding EF-hand superfamily protein